MRFLPYFAVYLVLKNDQNQILLSKRVNTGFMDGFYSLPSGHVDENESATTALERESLEEINIKPTDYKLVHTLHIKNLSDSKIYISFFFDATTFSGEVKNLEPDKCSQLLWADLDKLPKNVMPDLATVLKNIKLGSNYSEIGW